MDMKVDRGSLFLFYIVPEFTMRRARRRCPAHNFEVTRDHWRGGGNAIAISGKAIAEDENPIPRNDTLIPDNGNRIPVPRPVAHTTKIPILNPVSTVAWQTPFPRIAGNQRLAFSTIRIGGKVATPALVGPDVTWLAVTDRIVFVGSLVLEPGFMALGLLGLVDGRLVGVDGAHRLGHRDVFRLDGFLRL